MTKLRVRIAPSPTGLFHVGNLRTALTNYLFARSQKGEFIVRVEDTDQERLFPEAIPDMLKSLKWIGIEPNEGIVEVKDADFKANLDGKPDKILYQRLKKKFVQKGKHGPYFQSDRLDIYKEYADKLLKKGLIYPCFCTAEKLSKLRKDCQKKGIPPMYDRHCLKLSQEEIKKKIKTEPYVLRLKIPQKGKTVFTDLVRGKIEIENKVVDDPILIKSDGFPTYHFAVVIDDRLMNISHVFRGEEWISSVPKHLLIYKAFGWEPPIFGHLPQLLNMEGKKLSKRDGDTAVTDFRIKGYLPEALTNFIALLGWNPKTERELFEMKDLIKHFDTAKINKAGARFDYKRLDWFGSQYIKRADTKKLVELSRNYLEPFTKDKELIEKIVEVQKPRISYLSQVAEDIEFIFELPKYKADFLYWKDMDKKILIESLLKAQKIIEELDTKNLKNIENTLMEAAGEKRGEFLWPLRAALSGQKNSPSPFECIWMLGRKESIRRIEVAISQINLD